MLHTFSGSSRHVTAGALAVKLLRSLSGRPGRSAAWMVVRAFFLGLTRSHAVCGHDLPEALARWLGFRGGRVRPGCGRWPQNLLGLVEEPGDGGGRGPVFSGLLPARVGRVRRSMAGMKRNRIFRGFPVPFRI